MSYKGVARPPPQNSRDEAADAMRGMQQGRSREGRGRLSAARTLASMGTAVD